MIETVSVWDEKLYRKLWVFLLGPITQLFLGKELTRKELLVYYEFNAVEYFDLTLVVQDKPIT